MFEQKEDEGMKKEEWYETNKIKSQSLPAAFMFFFKQSCKDIKRNKCQYLLGFSSVFVVVLMTLIINTIVDKGPIIFLRLAEGNVGEIDALIESSKNIDGSSSSTELVNLTQFNALNPDEYLLSPRKRSAVQYSFPDNPDLFSKFSETDLLDYTQSQINSLEFDDTRELKLVTIDTDRERENN